jgi:hypothetical protein
MTNVSPSSLNAKIFPLYAHGAAVNPQPRRRRSSRHRIPSLSR